jgi:hypothetical protein
VETTPHAPTQTEQQLTDPDGQHGLPESDDTATEVERDQITPWGDPDDDRDVALYRAGWDQGVADRADRAREERRATEDARDRVRTFLDAHEAIGDGSERAAIARIATAGSDVRLTVADLRTLLAGA